MVGIVIEDRHYSCSCIFAKCFLIIKAISSCAMLQLFIDSIHRNDWSTKGQPWTFKPELTRVRYPQGQQIQVPDVLSPSRNI